MWRTSTNLPTSPQKSESNFAINTCCTTAPPTWCGMASIVTSTSSWCSPAAFRHSRHFSASGIMLRLSSFAALFLLASSPLLWAQTPPQPQSGEDPTFKVDTRLVELPVTVLNKDGKLITDLQQKSFKVFENGVEQPIKLFRHEDVPISLGIIIDNSGSMREKRQKVEVASVDLVKASNPHDEVFIVNFNDEAYLDVEMTNDIKKMEEGVARIDSRGGTAMREAINMSIDYLKEKGKNHKKVLLVVTDGNDNASTIGLERLVNRARQSEVLIYAIGLLDEE